MERFRNGKITAVAAFFLSMFALFCAAFREFNSVRQSAPEKQPTVIYQFYGPTTQPAK